MADKTADEIAADFVAMGHSVAVITDVIAGDSMADEEAESLGNLQLSGLPTQETERRIRRLNLPRRARIAIRILH